MDIELKPCPFCGNTKLKIESKHHGMHYYTGTHSASVRCSKCHARGPTASCKVEKENGARHFSADEITIQKAAELWNSIPREAISNDCKGCKHIGFRYPYASMYPCISCRRANPKDYYNVDLEIS
jgi:Lar family restriction alleviation protein